MTTMEDTGVGYNDEEDKDANGGNDGHGGNDPVVDEEARTTSRTCLLYTSPSPRDRG